MPLAHGIEPEERSRHVLSLIVDVVKSIHFGEVADFTLCNQDSAVSRSSVTLIRKAVCLTVLNSLPSDKPLLLHTIFEILYLKSILFPVLTRIGKDHLEDISNQICLQRPAKIQRKSKGRCETEKERAIELLKNLTRLGSESGSVRIGVRPIQLGFSCSQEWVSSNDCCSQKLSLEKMFEYTCSVGLMSVKIRKNPWGTQPWGPILYPCILRHVIKERVVQKVFGSKVLLTFYARAFSNAAHSERADDVEVEKNYEDFDGMEKYDTTLLAVTEKIQ